MFRNYLVTALRNHRPPQALQLHQHRAAWRWGWPAPSSLSCSSATSFRSTNGFRARKTSTGSKWRFSCRGAIRFSARTIPFPMPAEMRNEIPEVTAMTRIYNNYAMTLMVGDRQFRQQIDSVDPNFFSVIKLPLIKGDPARVFADPQSLVLSESAARKYFGDADPIGKIIIDRRQLRRHRYGLPGPHGFAEGDGRRARHSLQFAA